MHITVLKYKSINIFNTHILNTFDVCSLLISKVHRLGQEKQKSCLTYKGNLYIITIQFTRHTRAIYYNIIHTNAYNINI